MKEYIVKEIKPGKYEYGYRIQKLDIELMIEFGINLPNTLKEIYGNGFEEQELAEYIYINDPVTVEFIKRQYYIREYAEFSNMNIYELELLTSYYNKKLSELRYKLSIEKNKDELNNIKTDINILINEMLSITYLKEFLIKENKENKR
ncbi:MAG: hypothetical protein IKN63_00690 [Bacilli bacterium]|nr:hypothetical protein [Bacilli bacterium]